jgi:GTP-binding protein
MQRSTGTLRLFVDEVVIQVRGGNGGDGCVSFRREKYAPLGGPDGGDGGRGGAVYLVAQAGLDTLLDLAGRHHYHAESGRPGQGANKTGKSGDDLFIPVPPGTLVYDIEGQRLLKDLVEDGQRVRVARGGRGGKGNAQFVTSTHQAPRESTPGVKGQERLLRLELKLIADVGFAGLPNAGKSTLLSRLTRARPKIADYPFTTREPHLGIMELPGFRRLVLADLPGLLEGAHEGVGLGDAFLKHIERTRVVLHLVDLSPPAGSTSPIDAYRIIRRELEKYSATLAARREIIVGNKLDLTGADEALENLRQELGRPVLGISGVSGAGLRELAELLWTAVQEVRAEEAARRPALLDLEAPGTRMAPPADARAPDESDDDFDEPEAADEDADESQPGPATPEP